MKELQQKLSNFKAIEHKINFNLTAKHEDIVEQMMIKKECI